MKWLLSIRSLQKSNLMEWDIRKQHTTRAIIYSSAPLTKKKCERKPEYQEKTHTKHMSVQGNSALEGKPQSCEADMITTIPPYCPPVQHVRLNQFTTREPFFFGVKTQLHWPIKKQHHLFLGSDWYHNVKMWHFVIIKSLMKPMKFDILNVLASSW